MRVIDFSNLTSQTKEYAKKLGAELVGICKLNNSTNFLKNLKKISSFDSAIVIGYRHSNGAFLSNNIRAVQYDTFCIIQELNRIAFCLVRSLEKNGHDAIGISPFIPVEMSQETKGLVGDVSHRHLAEKAGLGGIGFSGLLITPNFGPRVRFASVLTTASLEPDEECKEYLCEDCEKNCVKACPVNAISEEGVDVKKCAKENMKFGLPGLVRHLYAISSTGDFSENVKNFLREPTFWELWQSTASGMFYNCFECVKACPKGELVK